jgi:tRNA pseudouridine38-40 synthase
MRNIALLVAYDGRDFAGSQLQQDVRSVQGALEQAWLSFAQERRRMTLAGRTDAGVHAAGQVVNVQTATRHDTATVVRGLNAYLPEDVAVLRAAEVDLDFHARFSAVRREYRYLIDAHPVALPQLRLSAAHVVTALDTAAMAEGLQALVGTYDFSAFCAAGPPGSTTVRTVMRAVIGREWHWGRELITVELAANAFLQHMVRVIVGTMIAVGQGRIPASQVAEIRDSGDRRRAGRTAPAHGLTLTAVHYPAGVIDWNGPERRRAAARQDRTSEKE